MNAAKACSAGGSSEAKHSTETTAPETLFRTVYSASYPAHALKNSPEAVTKNATCAGVLCFRMSRSWWLMLARTPDKHITSECDCRSCCYVRTRGCSSFQGLSYCQACSSRSACRIHLHYGDSARILDGDSIKLFLSLV